MPNAAHAERQAEIDQEEQPDVHLAKVQAAPVSVAGSVEAGIDKVDLGEMAARHRVEIGRTVPDHLVVSSVVSDLLG